MKISYTVFEDNGGGIHMIVNANGERHVFTHLESSTEEPIVAEMIDQLRSNPNAWLMWDGWEGEEDENDVADEIEKQDDMIAWGEDGTLETIDCYRIGNAGRDSLGIAAEEEE